MSNLINLDDQLDQPGRGLCRPRAVNQASAMTNQLEEIAPVTHVELLGHLEHLEKS